ncbi:dihydrolipoamide acetyltransferase family protein [Oceanithermus desulfurans]|uniref:Dihydrolipoamide acetyltransferase component of pyruvate dehydrogenase complex n=3 Tax=Oceanithermus TaxID=208447 RepID=A0A511RHZ3_9DEIN|nr:dihydrolipoamide acetyltransferase family protein [Oceanithermus desulfurans]MBB6030159.1 pyruvate dehydrogenase E2 component (dihydrolipoamide acetyltransferase) [Oceanithermus desulfurans]GEM88717.1 dihydrolipoamide acetyltransferase component of pyruvate dehydrogenase complex [Oceanithermus desulfurans NBRC 100063]
MPKEVLLPELAESVVEGEILKWLVNEGDVVAKDQPLVEVMTDKVTVELPSPFAGVLVKKLVNEGDVVPVETPIALIDESAGAAAAPEAAAAAAQSAPPEEAEDRGERLSLFKPDKTEAEVKNPFAGGAKKPAGPAVAERPRAGTNKYGRVLAVPAARQLARELGVDIAQVPGSGPNGRVRVEDVRAYAEQAPAAAATAAPAGFPPPVAYRTPAGYEELEERVPLRGMRRIIAQQMMASHLYTVRTLVVDEADVTELVALRRRLKERAEEAGVKLSYVPFIFKAAVEALKKFPVVNSSLDDARGEVVLKKYYHLGLSVATDAGLVVPVIRDVDRKTILELAAEIGDKVARARAGKLTPDEVTGSSFSVTSVGNLGGLFSFPIINVPDAAILGVHTIQKRPVVKDDAIVAREMLYLSLSFDHRLVDGAEATLFLREVVARLEDPYWLLLHAV